MDETLNVESSCNSPNEKKAVIEATAQTSDGSSEESLDSLEEFLEKGSKATKDSDFIKAVDYFSRALEITAAYYGELAPECVKLYYNYGYALLCKSKEVVDPIGAVPKKTLISSKKNQNVEEADDSDSEDIPDADEDDEDEDDADLDLAWKMLDIARAIVEKDSGDTMDKVFIWSALADVALQRDDIETSLSDYKKSLSILERLVEPDDCKLAELNLRLCLCLEYGSQPEEAISFCQKAISMCKSRVLRLTDEVKSIAVPTTASSTTGSEPEVPPSSSIGSQTDNNNAATEKQSEIESLSGRLVELEKKLEDLEQLVSNKTFIQSEILGANVEKITPPLPVVNSSQMGSANSGGGLDSSTVSTAHTKGAAVVTHLGVFGRGVKRVSTNSESEDSNPRKKLAIDSSSQDLR